MAFLAWSIYDDLKNPSVASLPDPVTWRNVKPEQSDWLDFFCEGCESPAEVKFLRAIVNEHGLAPNYGVLVSDSLKLSIQFVHQSFRYDFVIDDWLIVEIDGHDYHSSPTQKDRDRARDAFSRSSGFEVIRIPARVVFQDVDRALRIVNLARSKNRMSEKVKLAQGGASSESVAKQGDSFISKIDGFFDKIDATIADTKLMREVTSPFRKERLYLDMVVQMVENDQRIANMSPVDRDSLNDLLSSVNDRISRPNSLSDVCEWSKFARPMLDDSDLQGRASAAFDEAMAERSDRLRMLRERCGREPGFALLLSNRLSEARYPLEDACKVLPAGALMTFLTQSTPRR